jgi:hypothetical protein
MTLGAATDVRVARLTVAQVHSMLEAGILQEGQPVELIDGMLVYKDRAEHGGGPMTIGKKHNLAVKLLARLDPDLARLGCHMQTQGPLSLPPYDEPEPDGAILRGHPRDYAARLPEGSDTDSVIEVADRSLEYDRTHKLALYARAGLRQYVIVNLRENVVEVYESPVPAEGRFTETRVYRAGDQVSLHLAGGGLLPIDAAAILP